MTLLRNPLPQKTVFRERRQNITTCWVFSGGRPPKTWPRIRRKWGNRIFSRLGCTTSSSPADPLRAIHAQPNLLEPSDSRMEQAFQPVLNLLHAHFSKTSEPEAEPLPLPRAISFIPYPDSYDADGTLKDRTQAQQRASRREYDHYFQRKAVKFLQQTWKTR
jgi:hypothetical protein